MKVYETQKENRKERIFTLLQRYPDGLRTSDICELLNLEERTVRNYLTELINEEQVHREGWLYFALPARVTSSVTPTPEEAVTLYLAMRLLVKQNDRRNEIAETLLLRFADMLRSELKVGDDLLAAARELSQRPFVKGYEDIYRTVIRAYIYRCHVRIVYNPYQKEPFQTEFCPYLLEPSAIGYSTYVLGYSTLSKSLRTYKLERISHAELLINQTFEIPSDFPGLEVLRNAWSIYYGEETVRVVLRFQPEVARRVRETQWHPSQWHWEDEANPGCILFSIEVADTTDLLPWIRTWGANCEVVEPQELRESMMGQVRQLNRIYGISESSSNRPDHKRFADIFGD